MYQERRILDFRPPPPPKIIPQPIAIACSYKWRSVIILVVRGSSLQMVLLNLLTIVRAECHAKTVMTHRE